ncbi:MAG: biopolymer transporter ExbD [Elusimicrobia bacterium]|nr:biopolymer transporter ExbD [Elusimicrobiota bacterium]
MQIMGDDEAPVTGINVTPLVDVCLVLVIIFLVTAPILNQTIPNVDLPKASVKETAENSKTVITITKDNRWMINEKECLQKNLAGILPGQIKKTKQRLVVIRADRQARHGELMLAMQTAKNSGARSISIATIPTEQRP